MEAWGGGVNRGVDRPVLLIYPSEKKQNLIVSDYRLLLDHICVRTNLTLSDCELLKKEGDSCQIFFF